MTDDEGRAIRTTASDMRRYFDVTAEILKNRINVVGEAVVRVDQKLDSSAAEVRDEMRRVSPTMINGFSRQPGSAFAHA